jgi:hypothetical protein
MKRLLLVFPILLVISCGGGGGGGGTTPPPVVGITISPTSANVNTTSTQQFTATVTGTTNTGVTWQVNGVTSGNATVGTISAAGLYTAPIFAPNPATVTVTAVARADTSKTATASVTVVNVVAVHVSPSSEMIITSGTQQFTATVTGTTNTAVTWQVNGVTGGDSATVGTISTTGLYTAPAAVPSSAAVTVTAVSQAESAKSGSATVTIADAYSNGFLSGSYAFILSGTDKTSGFFSAVGRFTADGNGNLQNGVQDFNSGDFKVVQSLPFTGGYSIGSDGRGTASMTYQVTINSVLTTVTSQFRLLVESGTRVRLIGFDDDSASSGLMLKRDSSAFSTLNGNYAFGFNGLDNNAGAGKAVLSLAGEFQADGTNHITNGLEDMNDDGTVTSSLTFTGSYTLDGATGRGTMILTDSASQTSNLAFYIVDQNTLFFVETDFLPAVSGVGRLQQAASFSNSSLTGDYAFSLDTPVGNGSLVAAGRFTSDGQGALSRGSLAVNNSGALRTGVTFTGTASVAASGRGTLKWVTSTAGTVNYAAYFVSPQEAFVVQTDANNLSSGMILAQQGGPFSLSSISGSFGFNAFVENTYINQIGQVSADGAGSFTSGTFDANLTTNQTIDEALTSGSYTVASDGSGTASLSTSTGTENYIMYLVSQSKAFVIDTDSQKEALGNLEKQF